MFPILSNIPAIHATLIGIGVAFFSAFFIYALSQIKDAARNLEETIKLSNEILDFPIYNSNINNSKLLVDGKLDWELCKDLLWNVRYLYNTLKYDNNNINNLQDSLNQEIKDTTDILMELFYLFGVSYPFHNENAISAKIHELWDYERYSLINQRIDYLDWIWNSEDRNSLIEIFKKRDELDHLEAYERLVADVNKVASSAEDKKTKLEFGLNSLKRREEGEKSKTEYLFMFFRKIDEYSNRILPKMAEEIKIFQKYNQDYKLKKNSKKLLSITFFILCMGILLPILILNILIKINYTYHNYYLSYFEYLILVTSFSPYFLSIVEFFKYINNSNLLKD